MGVVSSAVFAARNTDKALHGDTGRTPVPIVQAYNSIHDLAQMKFGAISDGATNLLNKVDTLGKAAGVENAATKISGIASKAVNPLLCVASGVRVLKDKDQYSALIEEGLAMGAMFGAERGFKHLQKAALKAVEEGTVDNIIKNKTLQKWGNGAIEHIKNMSKTKHGKTAMIVAAELLFVAASVCAFNIGKKTGKAITGREGTNKASNNPFTPTTQSTS